MAYIVANGGNIETEKVQVGETRDQRVDNRSIETPRFAIRMQEDRDRWHPACRKQHTVGCLENVEGMLEIVICILLSVHLAQAAQQFSNLTCKSRN